MSTNQRMDQLSRNILRKPRCRVAAVWIAVAIGMAGGGGEAPAQSAGRHERLVAVPAPGPVTLDGDLQEWDRSGGIQSVYDPALADRFTATLAAMYDREALFLAAHVLDDTPLVNAHDPAVEPEIGWDGDAIQVRLTADASLAYPVQASTFGAQQNDPLSKDPRIVHLTLWQFSAETKPCVRLERGMDYHGAAMLVGRDAPVVFRKDDGR
ncbi:MAG TPA: hypothetical protein PLF81_31455, partial [Candidatus Anammoximicrobium sp.]|nr:hypothetical protein [Candidatus Anammoximicrobium sp.]